MARPLRLAVADGVYHVTARGNARAAIFRDDHDRRALLALLAHVARRCGWRCLSYCLMDNHFHLLLRTPDPNLPRGMQQLKGGYALAFNRRHERVGHLFAGRYGAQLVQQDAHLLETFRYIALNPVRAGLCRDPIDWSWSAHPALAGQARAPALLQVEEALSWFALQGEPAGPRRYLEFVSAASPLVEPSLAPVVGTTAFQRAVLPSTRPDPEVALREWGGGRPPLVELLSDPHDAASIARAYVRHSYTLTEIAEYLGVHSSTVSRRVRAHERNVLDCKI